MFEFIVEAEDTKYKPNWYKIIIYRDNEKLGEIKTYGKQEYVDMILAQKDNHYIYYRDYRYSHYVIVDLETFKKYPVPHKETCKSLCELLNQKNRSIWLITERHNFQEKVSEFAKRLIIIFGDTNMMDKMIDFENTLVQELDDDV